MKELEKLIEEKGKVLPGHILKVDGFLNHQLDVDVIDKIGKEFSRIFADIKPDKILTVESSGIAIAQATSMNMDKQPVLFAKKVEHHNVSSEVYQCPEKSYTTGKTYIVQLSKDYLKENDNILIIDDFLANGEALNALLTICNEAKVNVLGIGIVICKTFQPGYERIKKMCPRIELLAPVKSMSDDGKIEWLY